MRIFHDWSEWSVDTDNVTAIYDNFDFKKELPVKRVRKVVQVRICATCGLKQFKKDTFTV